MDQPCDYHTQIRMDLWDVKSKDLLIEDAKYCSEEFCSEPIENIIPLFAGNKKFYLGVCNRHLSIMNAFDNLIRKNDYIKVVDICLWEGIRNKSGPPELVGFPREDFPRGVKVWCKFCGKYHLHGIGDGHRSAHCAGVTPYSQYGYIVKRVEDSCPEYEGSHQWAIIRDFPPQSECQNCKMLVDGHLKKF